MIGLAKKFIARSLDRAGYRLLKNAEYSKLLAARAPSAQPLPLEPVPDPIGSSPSSNQSPESAGFPPGEADFRLFLKHARNLSGHSALCTLAVYSAVRYLTQAGIEGAAVDCGIMRWPPWPHGRLLNGPDRPSGPASWPKPGF